MSVLSCTPDQGVSQLVPEITVAPAAIDFGEQGVLVTHEAPLYVSNGGRVDLMVSLALDSSVPEFSIEPEEAVIGAGQTQTMTVRFEPNSYLTYTSALTIASNDQETPTIVVPITGVGIDAPLPDIEVQHEVVDFGTVAIGDSATEYVTLANTGRADLLLGTLGQSGSGAFSLGFDPSNQTVAPENELPLILTYTPTQDGGDNGTLNIPSNDPDEADTSITLIGNGGGSFEYPQAIIDCPGTSEPPVWVTLDGTDSFDPNGNEPLTYLWTLSDKPSYSQGELSDTITDTTRLFTDVAGAFEVTLVVTNSIGLQSAPKKCVIDAIPADDLHIELTWDTSRADLDLHLLEQGASFFKRPGDCNFATQIHLGVQVVLTMTLGST